MILSVKQLSIAKREAEKLSAALSRAKLRQHTDNSWLADIEVEALASQIADIEVEIQEYELLKNGQIAFSKRYSLADLPRILIQARIAKGLSQSDLAEALGMKPQQLQRYEASGYLGASLSRLIDIAGELDVQVSQSFSVENEFSGSLLAWTSLEDIEWERFPVEEMVRRKWFEPKIGQSLSDGAQSYVRRVAGNSFASALHRKKLRGKNLPDEAALLAWQARVLDLAERVAQKSAIPAFDPSEIWVEELVSLTRSKDGPAVVREVLASHGVILVVEPQLPGSYLDGAAMLSHSGHPVVALTLRFDRLDNFWFVLLHELGHVFRHLFDSTHLDFFDQDGPIGDDLLEKEANTFALDFLIPPSEWAACLSRFALTADAVRLDAQRLKVHPSIVAGRIRRERNDYTILSDLVGQGEVHKHFSEVSR